MRSRLFRYAIPDQPSRENKKKGMTEAGRIQGAKTSGESRISTKVVLR